MCMTQSIFYIFCSTCVNYFGKGKMTFSTTVDHTAHWENIYSFIYLFILLNYTEKYIYQQQVIQVAYAGVTFGMIPASF